MNIAAAQVSPRHITAVTDGSCLQNPDGPGGWAYLIKDIPTGRERLKADGVKKTTNNKMELLAAYKALMAIRPGATVTLESDSQYVVNGMNNWCANWKMRGWKTADKQPVKNKDLWLKLEEAVLRHVSVKFVWVRGHAGHTDNERVDAAARKAAEKIQAAMRA